MAKEEDRHTDISSTFRIGGELRKLLQEDAKKNYCTMNMQMVVILNDYFKRNNLGDGE